MFGRNKGSYFDEKSEIKIYPTVIHHLKDNFQGTFKMNFSPNAAYVLKKLRQVRSHVGKKYPYGLRYEKSIYRGVFKNFNTSKVASYELSDQVSDFAE